MKVIYWGSSLPSSLPGQEGKLNEDVVATVGELAGFQGFAQEPGMAIHTKQSQQTGFCTVGFLFIASQAQGSQ